MFIGHVGVSFAGKAADRRIPLWVLFLAAQLLDIAWAALVLLGVERVRVVEGFTTANDLDFVYMPYTHSLAAAFAWAILAAVAYRVLGRPRWGGSALLVGVVVLSHWLLDWLVHVPDLPLYGDELAQGLGLWTGPLVLAFLLEGGAWLGGLAWHLLANRPHNRLQFAAYTAFVFASFAQLTLGPPPSSGRAMAGAALLVYGVHTAIARWLDRPPDAAAAAVPD